MPRTRQQTLHDHFQSSSSPVHSRSRSIKRSTSTRNLARRNAVVEISSTDEGSSSDVDRIKFEPKQVADTTEDDEVAPSSPIKSQVTQRFNVIGSDSERDHQDTSQEDDSASKGVGVRWLRLNKKNANRKLVVDSDTENERSSTRKRRKLVKGVRPSSDEDSIFDDLDREQITETRLRKRAKPKTKFEKNLDKLRKKKNEQIASASESSSGGKSDDEPFSDARPDVLVDEGCGFEDENDDFIVSDDGNTTSVQLPAAFSMGIHQDLSYHFKAICQYFVHLAIAGVDSRRDVAERLQEDEYFSLPIQIVRRKTSGIRDTVASSVWRPHFKKALQIYPVFEVSFLDFSVPNCDACHMGGRLSTFIGRVGGSPYDKLTFEPLDNDSESESESSDERTEAEDGSEPAVQMRFNMGRFCARRSRLFHKFVHWEYALYTALSEEIQELQAGDETSTHFKRVAYARDKKPPEDLSDPDKVMEWLDERGVINDEWAKLKDMIEGSSNLDARGDDDVF